MADSQQRGASAVPGVRASTKGFEIRVGSIREAVQPDDSGILSFLGRLARFGLVAEAGTLLKPINPGS